MNFKELPENKKKEVAKLLFQPLNSAQELKDWVMFFLGLDMPIGTVDPDSNASPIDAMWEIYKTIKENTADEIPGYIMLSARECYKTLGASILEALLMLHFEVTIAHMAAIQSQSAKAIQYINLFFNKLAPLMEIAGWVNTSQNKGKIEFRTPAGEDVYIRVIVCTLGGANCVDPGSLIVTKNGDKRAAEIEEGEEILTYNYKTNQKVWVTAQSVSIVNKSTRKLKFKSGKSIVLSDDHPVFTDTGWIRASQIRLGDKAHSEKSISQSESSAFIMNMPKRDLEQIILGTLLGDASIHKIPSGKVRYSVSHSKNNADYIYLIRDALALHGIKSSVCKDKNNLKLTSSTGKYFERFYELAIKNGKKTVTEEWLNLLNDEGIAYWMMDDGSGNPSLTGSSKEHSFRLATCGFSLEENNLIQRFFSKRGYTCTVKSVSNQNKKIYPYISFELNSSRNLSSNIKKYFVGSLRYKLLSSVSEATETWAIDSGEQRSIPYLRHGRFHWDKNPNSIKSRKLSGKIKESLNDEVVSIELMGFTDLVDLSINNDDKTLHSFYCNGVLVHNSEHTTLMFVDEIDVVKDPMAYEEAKLIPGYSKGRHPLTIKLSTRKFSFGLMQQEIDKAPIAGDKIVRWNIIDVTERCPESRHKPDLPKEDRYITKALPPRQLTHEEYDELPEAEKTKWEFLPQVHNGCLTCPLLAVCRTKLADRPPEAMGGLYKPIKAVINTFRKTNPDMGEAQLMCWKPSSKGLVYPRFDSTVSKDDRMNTNVITLEKAMTTLLGGEDIEKTARELGFQFKKKVSEIDLLHIMQTLGIRFYAGVDWGYTHDFVIVIFAMIPNGEIWVVDIYMAPGLEFQDMLSIAINYRDKYKIEKWFCDQAMPSHIKSFNKNAMKSPSFTKDVMGGIEALRSKIVDGAGRRWLKVLYTEAGMKVINAFVKHHFKLDGAGNPTLEPDDTPGIADPADAMRYIAQNLFPVKGPQKPGVAWTGPDGKPIDGSTPEGKEELRKRMEHANQMREEIQKRIGGEEFKGGTGRKGGFHFNF